MTQNDKSVTVEQVTVLLNKIETENFSIGWCYPYEEICKGRIYYHGSHIANLWLERDEPEFGYKSRGWITNRDALAHKLCVPEFGYKESPEAVLAEFEKWFDSLQ
jgi:hypothetical protein